MNLLRHGLDVHRRGTVDERRRWVLQHAVFSGFAVSLTVTIGLTVAGLLVGADAVTVPAVVALFAATFGAALLLLALASRKV